MRTLQYSSLHRQSGMVLIVSLFIMVLLIIIGVSGMKVTGLEEKMAGNDRDQSLAFQAAETALREAEMAIKVLYETNNLDKFCDGTINDTNDQRGLFVNDNINDGGNCKPCPATPTADCALPNPMNIDTWKKDSSSSVAIPEASLFRGTTARYYIIYHYFYSNKGADKTINSYYFSITARGLGEQGSEVLLRSYFGGKMDMGQI